MASKGNIANLRPWRPGESGNPGGRPSDREAVQHALRKTRGGIELVDHYLDLARHARKENLRLDALNALWDRVFGRPPSGADHAALLGALRGTTEVHFRATFGSPAPEDASVDTSDAIKTVAIDMIGAPGEMYETAETCDAETAETAENPALLSTDAVGAEDFSSGDN